MQKKLVDESIGAVLVQGSRGSYVVKAPTGYFTVVSTLRVARQLARAWAEKY